MAVVFHSKLVTLPLHWNLLQQQHRHCHSSCFLSFVCVCQQPTLLFEFNRPFFIYTQPNRENVLQRFESRRLELMIRYQDSTETICLGTWCWAPQWTWNDVSSRSCHLGYKYTFLKKKYRFTDKEFKSLTWFATLHTCETAPHFSLGQHTLPFSKCVCCLSIDKNSVSKKWRTWTKKRAHHKRDRSRSTLGVEKREDKNLY